MRKADSLQSLMSHIARVWVCNPHRYPALAGMSAEERKNFLLKHSLLHIAKTAAKVAAVCESFDHAGHGSPEDEEALKVAATKMVVNALKLAEEAGLTAEELFARAPQYIT